MQDGGGPTHFALSTSDLLLFPNMKIQLNGIIGFIAKIKF